MREREGGIRQHHPDYFFCVLYDMGFTSEAWKLGARGKPVGVRMLVNLRSGELFLLQYTMKREAP